MKKSISIVLLAVLFGGLVFVGCGSENSGGLTEDGLPIIRVATLGQQLSLPMHYISKQGWDVENGFKLDITTFSQGTGINEALGSGLVDVATIGAAAVSSCSVYDAVYLFSHEDSSAGQQAMIRKDSDIAKARGITAGYEDVLGSPESVKDARILLPMGTGAHMLVSVYLDIIGLTEEDVTLINMDTAASYQAFVSGEGDICLTAYPTADNFIASDYEVAFSMISTDTPYYDNIVASKAFYEDAEKREALVALAVQLMRCAEEFNGSDDITMDSMMEWYGINGQQVNKEDIAHQVLSRPFFTYDDYKSLDTTRSFKETTDFYALVGNISPEDKDKVYANIKTDVLESALVKYEEMYR